MNFFWQVIINEKRKSLQEEEYRISHPGKIPGAPGPGGRPYEAYIKNVNAYNTRQTMYQNKFKALRSQLDEMYPPYYWGDVNISNIDEFVKSVDILVKRFNRASDHFY